MPFPLKEKPRRVSEQGAGLGYGQTSHRQFQSDQCNNNSVNYYGGSTSHDSETNSGMAMRTGSGLNYSDGAARYRSSKPPLA